MKTESSPIIIFKIGEYSSTTRTSSRGSIACSTHPYMAAFTAFILLTAIYTSHNFLIYNNSQIINNFGNELLCKLVKIKEYG